MANLAKMMKQAKKMQSQMAQVQDEIARMEYTFTVGGGAVEVVARGDQSIASIKIDRAAVDPEDVESLEDLVLTAVNGALDKIKAAAEQKMADVTGGLNLPGLM